MEQEKDNFWLWVGGGIALIAILVVAFKSFHGDQIPTAYSETKTQIDKQIENQHGK